MYAGDILEYYFEWLCDIVCQSDRPDDISYERLLRRLHGIPFRWSRTLDADRADWGIDMRYRFAQEQSHWDRFDVREHIDGPCTVFEMMVALAVRCEEDLMDDPDYGDRTSQWFWGMIVSLGLGAMYNHNYDERYVDDVIERFLDREYEPNGKGGLFTLRHAPFDSRNVDIWHQLCWYLDELAGDIPYRGRIRKE